MAQGTSMFQNLVACRFFLSGNCKDGENCVFSHDRTRHVPDSVCRYYLQGTCAFGVQCRYDHILLKEEDTSGTNSIYDNTSTDFSNFSIDSSASGSATMSDTEKRNWVHAPEFVPKYQRSYADIVKADINNEQEKKSISHELCPFFAEGECPFTPCQLVHGNVCELCQKAYIHPFDEEARKSHIEKCEKELERDMEYAFDIQNSLKKACGICMDIVLEKEHLSDRRFGLLENCNHVYCLTCIRKWRRAKQYQNNDFDPSVTRACPECRVVSDFIIPSEYFVDAGSKKQKLITEYKNALSKRHCKYFKRGDGVCPFGGSCFYLHAKPDGTKVDLPIPVPRRRQNQDGDLENLEIIYLWNFLEHREETSPL